MKRGWINKTAKPHTLGWYKKSLWSIFSKYIRTRDNHVCFTCDAQLDMRSSQAGHMIPRASGGLSLYFHEDNVHAQCFRCNMNLGGNGAEYARRFILRYGKARFNNLIKLRDTGYLKYNIDDYKRLIEEYKVKLDEVTNTNGRKRNTKVEVSTKETGGDTEDTE